MIQQGWLPHSTLPLSVGSMMSLILSSWEIGKPYVLQTNLCVAGDRDWEQCIKLWFDPTADSHSYMIQWSKKMIVFMVDDTPIWGYKNNEHLGVPRLCQWLMSVFASLWNGEEWATQSGSIKLNWAKAPFATRY